MASAHGFGGATALPSGRAGRSRSTAAAGFGARRCETPVWLKDDHGGGRMIGRCTMEESGFTQAGKGVGGGVARPLIINEQLCRG